MKKSLLTFARIFVGILFIFSGLIKANDPLGFGYKLQEYFEVFHIAFLNDFATAFAIIICAFEIIAGAALLLGIKSIQVAWGLLILIVLFTFLTFYSAAFDVVKSCGCFGDAIPLTPWQSFMKDLVLLVLIIYIFIHRTKITPVIKGETGQRVALSLITLASFGFGLYTYSYLPVIDFLPYKVGANIPEQMRIPEGAPLDVYEISYNMKNKKTGEEKVVTDKEYLNTGIWKDESWEIVGDPKSKLISKGFEVKIKDLKITDSQGTNYNSELLENPYYSIVIVAYDLSNTNIKAVNELNALAINAVENYNIRTVLLTSNSAQTAEEFSKKNKLMVEVFYADAVPLRSMVRANPGVLLLKDGIVIGKWHYNTLPSYNELEEKYFSKN